MVLLIHNLESVVYKLVILRLPDNRLLDMMVYLVYLDGRILQIRLLVYLVLKDYYEWYFYFVIVTLWTPWVIATTWCLRSFVLGCSWTIIIGWSAWTICTWCLWTVSRSSWSSVIIGRVGSSVWCLWCNYAATAATMWIDYRDVITLKLYSRHFVWHCFGIIKWWVMGCCLSRKTKHKRGTTAGSYNRPQQGKSIAYK